MAIPYTPSQLVLNNFDATQAATATWVFSSSDTTVTQASFDLQIYNNTTGSLVLDTSTVSSSSSQYTIPTSTLVNRTQYKWRVMYTDTSGNASSWSTYQVFTCSSLPTTSITSPAASATIAGNIVTITANYQQLQSVAQQSYRIVLYSSDQTTIVSDSGTVYNTANQYTISGLSNGTYYAQSTVTSADGLSASSGKIQFTISYSSGTQTPSITLNPLSSSASMQISWHNPKSFPGTYAGTTPTYKPGKFNQAIQIANYGEKVYWQTQTFTQFTYTSWVIPNLASSSMTNNQVFARLQADTQNYIQVRYDPVNQAFIFEQSLNGLVSTMRSQTGITFSGNSQIFIGMKQNTTFTGYVGIGGTFYTISSPSSTGGSSNTFGVATFGSSKFTTSVSGVVPNIQYAYMGCTPANGNEINALIDQTHLTSLTMTDSAIQNLYTNSTNQTYTYQSIFLANFDNNLEGGDLSGSAVSYWGVNRVYNGVSKTLGTVTNTQQTTPTLTDTTPLSGFTYTYNVIPYDSNGNPGAYQSVTGSVAFDGWWLTDTTTSTSFQFLANIGDSQIKTNYKRTQYETFGTYPIVVYAPTKYKSGKLTGWIVNNINGSPTPLSQYQTLQGMIDNHHQLLLRDNTGWGLIVDCYDTTNTLPQFIADQYNTIEITWTEVASA